MKRPTLVDKEIKEQKKSAFWTYVSIGVAVTYIIVFYFFSDKLDRFKLLRERNGSWEVVSTLPGSPHKFFQARDGSFVIENIHPYSLNIYSNDEFKTLTESDLPFGSHMTDNGLATAEGRIWSVGDGSIVGYEGGSWKTHTPEIDYSGPVKIVANQSSVWVLDSKGRLLFYDGMHWKKLIDSGLAAAKSSCENDSLHVSPENQIWLTCDGVWKLKDSAWEEILYRGEKLDLDKFIGFTKLDLWGKQYTNYYRVPFAGGEIEKAKERDFDLETRSLEIPVVNKHGEYSIYADEKLFSSTGYRWDVKSALPSLPREHRIVLDASFDDIGKLWVLGNDEDSDWAWAFLIWQVCCYALAGIFSSKLFGREKVDLTKAAIKTLPPDPIVPTIKHYKPSFFLRLLTFPLRVLWLLLLLPLPLFGAWIALRFFDHSFLWWVPAAVVGFSVMFASAILPIFLAIRWLLAPASQGNYAHSFSRLEFWRKFGFAPAINDSIHLFLLFFSGKFEEVLIFARKRIEIATKMRDGIKAASGLTLYATALLGLGRFVEAEELLEDCVKISPESFEAKKNLALSLLLQDKEGERALMLLEEAFCLEQKRKFSNLFGKEEYWNASEIQGYLAWALALLGRNEESRQALDKANRLLEKKFIPQVACLHYCNGHILRLSKKTAEAKREFAMAEKIDPHGAMKIFAERAVKDFRFF